MTKLILVLNTSLNFKESFEITCSNSLSSITQKHRWNKFSERIVLVISKDQLKKIDCTKQIQSGQLFICIVAIWFPKLILNEHKCFFFVHNRANGFVRMNYTDRMNLHCG